MIPKIIHYCWFGGREKSEEIKKCINSWKRILPEYRILEWNESNFDVNSIAYVREAYKKQKYAFVSDYVRLYALKNNGGIYLDTDVEVKRSFDEFLNRSEVFGFEASNRVATAVIMAQKESQIINQWLNTYKERHFINGRIIDMTPNVCCITNILKEEGLIMNGMRQELSNTSILVCERTAFCPYSIGDLKNQEFRDSYAVHWCEGSWVSGKILVKHSFIRILKKIIGYRNYYRIKSLKDRNKC